jgi:putative oxidoreductase
MEGPLDGSAAREYQRIGVGAKESPMERWLSAYSEIFYGVTRIVIGFLFAGHGAQKLFGVLGGQAQTGNPMMIAAGTIELVAGLFIALGVWAGYAAFVASGEMAVAYFTAHAPSGWSPLANHGELAALYCFIFLFIASKGSGRLSLDALMGRLVPEMVQGRSRVATPDGIPHSR